MLLGGRKGHLALLDWQQRHLVCEVQVQRSSKPHMLAVLHFHGTLCMCMLPHLRSALSDVMRTPKWPHGAWHHVKLLRRRGWDVREGRKPGKVENSGCHENKRRSFARR